jgi:hypothetical protein
MIFLVNFGIVLTGNTYTDGGGRVRASGKLAP